MDIKRILIIRFSSLGDIILLTPLFRETRKRFPAVKIDFLTSTTFATLCSNNPHLNRIITLERTKGLKEVNRVIQQNLANNYDLILDAHRSIRSRLLLLRWFGWSYFLTKRISRIDKRSFKRNLLILTGVNLLKNHLNQRQAYCLLLKRFTDLSQQNTHTELFPGEREQQHVNQLMAQFQLNNAKLIAIDPGASFSGKCWPKEHYLELIAMLQQRGYKVILVGGEKNQEALWIYRNSKQKPVNMTGLLSFLDSAELLRHCQLSISNDTALAHFAEAMEKPAISIFGPTSKEFGFAPFLEKSKLIEIPLKCRPCSRNGKGKCRNKIDRQCLGEIPVETVLKEALQILN